MAAHLVYFENSDSENDEVQPPCQKKRRGTGISHIFNRSFQSKQEAKNFVQGQKTWNQRKEKSGIIGYDCGFNRTSVGKQNPCPAKAYLKISETSQSVDLYFSETDHSHGVLVKGLSENERQMILELFDSGVTKPQSYSASFAASEYCCSKETTRKLSQQISERKIRRSNQKLCGAIRGL